MRIPSLLQAPGIQAMEKGQPWAIPGNVYPSPSTTPIIRLQSIQNILTQTTETHIASPLLPVSMTNELRPVAVAREHTEYPSEESFSTISFTVPKEAQKASGGCFDANNWIFQIVWEKVCDMNLSQLLSAHFYREDRGKYGEHHTSTRGAAPFNECSEELGHKMKGNENHRHQEQGRRVRHRYLQGEADAIISKFTLDMAQDAFPKIKAMIQQMHEQPETLPGRSLPSEASQREEKLRGAGGPGKKLGKDDQLTAALMSQHMANILIFRMHQELADARETIKELEVGEDEWVLCQNEDAQHNQANSADRDSDASHWQLQFEKSEAERRSLEDEVLQLRRQLQDAKVQTRPFNQSLLPLPVVSTAAKRYLDMAHGSSALPHQGFHNSCEHQAKRRHLGLELTPFVTQTIARSEFPLSPAPSDGGSPSPQLDCSRFGPNGADAQAAQYKRQ